MGIGDFLLEEATGVAVVWSNEDGVFHQLTYDELRQKIHARADYFQKNLGIHEGNVIAVLAPRGPEYLLNLFALWQIGAVYLPLSDAWEDEAILARLNRSGAKWLLTTCVFKERLNVACSVCALDDKTIEADIASIVLPDKLLSEEMPEDSPAYICSSSGTTGEPKLIELPFSGIVDRIRSHIHIMGIKPEERNGVLGFIDFGFDASLAEMLLSTISRSTLYIASEKVRKESHQELPAFLDRCDQKINVAILLPSVLNGLHPDRCLGLKKIVTMGEKCVLPLLQRWFDRGVEIFNGYGPTETTIGATLTPLSKQDTVASLHHTMTGIKMALVEVFELAFNEKPGHGSSTRRYNTMFLFQETEHWRYAMTDYLGNSYEGTLSGEALQQCNELNKPTNPASLNAKQKLELKQKEDKLLQAILKKESCNRRVIAYYDDDRIQLSQAFQLNQTFQRLQENESSYPVKGEIWISSNGMGRYLNHEEKQKEKFLKQEEWEKYGFKHPVFCSGDIAQYYKDSLVYCHRNDRQVKRYGKLVILDDIEDLLLQCEAIREVVVLSYQPKYQVIVVDELPQTIDLEPGKLYILQKFDTFCYAFQNDNAFGEVRFEEKLSAIDSTLSAAFAHALQQKGVIKNESLVGALIACTGCAVNQSVVPAFLVQDTDKIKDKDVATQAILTYLSDPNKVEAKHRPTCCFWVNAIPVTVRNKISHDINDYEKKTPSRLQLIKSPLTSDEINKDFNRMIQKLSKCWQALIEGDLDQRLKLKSDFIYDTKSTFFELGGDSVLMTQLIQVLWKEVIKGLTPSKREKLISNVPADFREGLRHHSMLQDMAGFLEFYASLLLDESLILGYHPPVIGGLPVFYFSDHALNIKEGVLDCPLYEIPVPSIDGRYYESLVSHWHRLIQEKQLKGPYYFIVTPPQYRLVESLKQQCEDRGEKVYLTMIKEGTFSESIVQEIEENKMERNKLAVEERLKNHEQEIKQKKKFKITPNQQTYEHLDEHIQSDTSVPLWLIGPEDSGKTSILNQYVSSCDLSSQNKFWIFLDVAGISKENVFQTALESAFGKWCDWEMETLKTIPLCVLIDHYDAIARLDHSALWREANQQGFQHIQWIIACRDTYWQDHGIYLKELLVEDGLIFKERKTSGLGIAEKIQKFDEFEQRYEILTSWFRREYLRKTPPANQYEENDYVALGFQTLRDLYHHYQQCFGNISLAFEPSPWESPKILRETPMPCPQTLLGMRLVRPLLQKQKESDDVSVIFTAIEKEVKENLFLQRYHEEQESLGHHSLTAEAIYRLRASVKTQFPDTVIPLKICSTGTPLFLFYPITGDVPKYYEKLAEVLGDRHSVYALRMGEQAESQSGLQKVHHCVHVLQAVQPQGPYLLLGWSYGALLAYQVAQILEQENPGYPVALVINIDGALEVDDHLAWVKFIIEEITKSALQDNAFSATNESLLQIKENNTWKQAEGYVRRYRNKLEKVDEQRYQIFIQALRKVESNLKAYGEFMERKADSPLLKAPFYVFRAKATKNLGHWSTICATVSDEKIVDGDHFSLFHADLFTRLREILSPYQGEAIKPLAQRLLAYKEKRIRKFEDCQKDNEDLQGIYIEARASSTREGQEHFPIEEKIQGFLNNSDSFYHSDCFLIQGDPGSGKSHYGRQLEYQLFTKENPDYFPLWITLRPGEKNRLIMTLKEQLQLTNQEVKDLIEACNKKDKITKILGAQLLVIFDGYDEALTNENIFITENLESFGAKAILSCRSYAVDPHTQHQQFGDHFQNLQTCFLQPFTEDEIINYLNAYQKKSGRKLDRKVLDHLLDRRLIQNPLLLSIAVLLWDHLSTYKNRAALYQAFFESLYEQDCQNIQKQEGIRVIKKNQATGRVDLKTAFRYYHQREACDYGRNVKKIILENHDSRQVRQSDRLGISAGCLTHITFWEFQLACATVEAVLFHPVQDLGKVETVYPPFLGELFFCENLSLLELIRERVHLLSSSDHLQLQHRLFLMVYASRIQDLNFARDQHRMRAASNAISILTVIQTPFSGMNLREIRVSKAYLATALCDSTDFTAADLHAANFKNAFLYQTNFSSADLTDIVFGQKPGIKFGGSVGCVSFNSRGTQIAVAIGSRIEILDLVSGERLQILSGHAGVLSLDFSLDGAYLASGSKDGTIKIWNVSAESELRTLIGHKHWVRYLSFGGKELLSQSQDHILKIWDVLNGLEIHSFQLASSFGFVFSSNRKLLAFIGKPEIIKIYDVLSNQEIRSFSQNSVSEATFSPDGKHFVSGSLDGTVKIWEISSGRVIRVFGRFSWIRSLCMSDEQDLLVFEGCENKIKVLKFSLRDLVQPFGRYIAPRIRHVNFSRDGKQFISTCGEVVIWDALSTQVIQIQKAYDHLVYSPDNSLYSPDNSRLMLASYHHIKGYSRVTIFELSGGRMTQILNDHLFDSRPIMGTFSPTALVAFLDIDRRIKICCALSGQVIQTLEPSPLDSVIFSHDGKQIARMKRWKGLPTRLPGTLAQRPMVLVYEEAIEIYNLFHSQVIQRLICQAGFLSLAFSYDGKYLVSANGDRKIRIWDVLSGEVKQIFSGHLDDVEDASFSPNGKYVVSRNRDWSIIIWNLESGEPVQTLKGYINKIVDVTFSPDSQQIIASGGSDIMIWQKKTDSKYPWQLRYRFTQHPNLVLTKAIIKNTRLSVIDFRLLEQEGAVEADSAIIITKEETSMMPQREAPCLSAHIARPLFPLLVFSGMTETVFLNVLNPLLTTRSWLTLASLNKACYQYFGVLWKIGEILTNQYLSLPSWVQGCARFFEFYEEGFGLVYQESNGQQYPFFWPDWFFHMTGLSQVLNASCQHPMNKVERGDFPHSASYSPRFFNTSAQNSDASDVGSELRPS